MTESTGWTNDVAIEGTVKAKPTFKRNATNTDQAFFEVCHESQRASRIHRNWFRIAAHGAFAKKVVEGDTELGRGLIAGDRVLIHGRLGARPKKCGGNGCKLMHNHWWVNIDAKDGGAIELIERSLTESWAPKKRKKLNKR